MADEDDQKEYRWESGYEKTWEAIREDDEGLLASSVDEFIHRAKRRRLLEKRSNIRLGMMRHLYVIIDLSEAMLDQDLKPTRQKCTMKLLEVFVEEYFDQNPISQLGIIWTRGKRAEKLTELAGNPKKHVAELRKAAEMVCEGEPSLQNSLDLAAQTLKHLPGHVSREIVIVMASLTTCDPGNIYATVDFLKTNHIQCSVIGLAAEIRVCKVLCKETTGTYRIILDETHFKELLLEHVSPPPTAGDIESSLIRMGFPHHMSQGDEESMLAMCMCHLDSKAGNHGMNCGGYFCPQCNSKYCELPVECKACGLTLVSAPHLARSYHHLFPLEHYEEVPVSSLADGLDRLCFACRKDLSEATQAYVCNTCQFLFCIDCDVFVHESLRACPGCANSPKVLERCSL